MGSQETNEGDKIQMGYQSIMLGLQTVTKTMSHIKREDLKNLETFLNESFNLLSEQSKTSLGEDLYKIHGKVFRDLITFLENRMVEEEHYQVIFFKKSSEKITTFLCELIRLPKNACPVLIDLEAKSFIN